MSHESTGNGPASSRRLFLRRAAGVAAAGTAAVILPADAFAGGNGRTREDATNFADLQRHENDHVAALLAVLGEAARPRPVFQNLIQSSYQDFLHVSQALENTGVGAYLGAAPAIASPGVLAAAGSIALIEARHAGWLNARLGSRVTADAFGAEQSFERALTAEEVGELAGLFIADLNGGPPIGYDTAPSAANDVAILNFALALEYLEQEFYNLNVPKFLSRGK